jgi:hypothetical protein
MFIIWDCRSSHAHGVIAFFLEHFAYLFFIHGFACVVEFQFIFAATHPKYLESIDLWDELWCACRQLFGVALQIR